MKNTLYIIGCLLVTLTGICNANAQQTIPVSGGNAVGSNGSVTYTVGQLAYTSSSSGNASSTPGLQVALEVTTTGIHNAVNGYEEIKAYPNPVVSSITLKQPHLEALTYELYDISGKRIVSEKIHDDETTINMETLAAGTYILKVNTQQATIKTFNIIKH